MGALALFGILLTLTPFVVFVREFGWRTDPGDLVLWLMSKNAEQILLLSACPPAGVLILTVALAQKLWVH